MSSGTKTLQYLQDRADPVAYLSRLRIAHRDARGFVKSISRWHLDPYQKAFLRSRSDERLVLKARQCGGTQMIAGEALWLMKHYPKSDVLVVSDSQDHAQNVVQKVLDLAASDSGVEWRGNPTETAKRLRLPNGSSLRSLSSSSSSSRSFTAQRVYLDEFAFARYAQEIIVAARGTLALGGQLSIISTPYLQSGPFYELYLEARGIGSPELLMIHWSECPRYNPAGWQEPEAARRIEIGREGEWYQRERRRFRGDDAKWRREYECDFEAGGGRVFPQFSPSLHVIPPFKPDRNWTRILGIDPGIRQTAAIWIAVDGNGVGYVYNEYSGQDQSIRDNAYGILRGGGASYAVIDPSAYARTENEATTMIHEYARFGLYATGNRTSKDAGIMRIREMLLPDPELGKPTLYICANCPNLIRELETYSYRTDDATQPLKRHDHFVDALRYALMTRPGRMPIQEKEPEEIDKATGLTRVERIIWEESQRERELADERTAFELG